LGVDETITHRIGAASGWSCRHLGSGGSGCSPRGIGLCRRAIYARVDLGRPLPEGQGTPSTRHPNCWTPSPPGS